MRFALIGDSHLDRSSRWEETLRIHRSIAEDLWTREVDAIGHSGDLWHAKPNREERAAAAEWLAQLAEIAPVIAVNGNHSPPECLATLDSRFDPNHLAELLGWPPSMVRPVRAKHPVTVESAAGVHIIAGCAVACLGWPSRAQLLSYSGADGEEAKHLGHEALQNVLRGLGTELAKHDGPRLFIGHTTITGAKSGVGFEMIGTSFELGLSDLALVGADGYGLGHIHEGPENQWTIGEAPVWYSGSPRHVNWGETSPRYYTIVDIVGHKATVEYIRTPAHGMLTCRVQWTPGVELPEWMAALGKDFYDKVTSEGELKLNGEEVRVQYDVASEHRPAAAASAREFADTLLACGASDVQLEPKPIITTRARAPEVSTATTTPGKLQALWRSKGPYPEPELEVRLSSKVDELEKGLDDSYKGRRTGAIVPERIVLHNVGTYRHAELDIAGIDGELVAVVGDNGAGKSLCFEMGILGGLYRDTVNHGTIKDRATAKDSFVQVTVINGARYTIKQSHDALTDSAKALITNGDGHPVLPAAGVNEYKAWAKENLLSSALLKASLFSAQRITESTGSFLSMKDAARIDVALEAIGCGQLEKLAGACRDRAKNVKKELDVTDARLTDERSRGGDVAQAEQSLVDERMGLGPAQWALGVSRDALSAAELQVRDYDKAQEAYVASVAARGELESKIRDNRAQHSDQTERLQNNRKRLAQKPKILAAVKRSEELNSAIASTGAKLAQLNAERQGFEREQAALKTESAGHRQSAASAQARANAATQRLARKPEIDASAARVPGLRKAWEEASKSSEETITMVRGDIAAAESTLERLRQTRLTGANERIGQLRNGLGVVAGMTSPVCLDAAVNVARDTLDTDNAYESTDTDLPEQTTRQAAEVTRLRRLLNTVTQKTQHKRDAAARELSQAEQLAAEAKHLDAAQKELEASLGDLKRYQQAEQACVAKSTEVLQKLTATSGDRDSAEKLIFSFKAELQKLDAVVACKEQADKAEARIEQLEKELARLDAEHSEFTEKLALCPAVVLPPPPPPDLQGLRLAVSTSEGTLHSVTAAIARAEQRLELAQKSAARVDDLDLARRQLADDLSDWNRLASDLGRGGVQALEIDCLGPELTEIVNDMLECHGGRFSMKIETQRSDSKNEKMIEQCGVMVYDSRDGSVREARKFSGGETVILDEAMSLSLAILACRRAGIEGAVLFRDETSGPLSTEQCPVYVRMLRRAVERTRASKVIFVAHQREIQDMADRRICIQYDREYGCSTMQVAE